MAHQPGRDLGKPHRAATSLELLFDLCFVIAVVQASGSLHEALTDGEYATGVGAVRRDDPMASAPQRAVAEWIPYPVAAVGVLPANVPLCRGRRIGPPPAGTAARDTRQRDP